MESAVKMDEHALELRLGEFYSNENQEKLTQAFYITHLSCPDGKEKNWCPWWVIIFQSEGLYALLVEGYQNTPI